MALAVAYAQAGETLGESATTRVKRGGHGGGGYGHGPGSGGGAAGPVYICGYIGSKQGCKF